MSSNKYLVSSKSKLLNIKLERLSRNLQSSIKTGQFETKEALLFESIKIMGDFARELGEPSLKIDSLVYDSLPDLEAYNKLWQQLLDDLVAIFAELENIESLTVANFNFITTESNRLTARLKNVSSKLGDFILYSLNPTKDAFFFKDSFNDLSKIEPNIALLNTDECDINQVEGIITLPIDRDKKSFVNIQEAPIVNPNSNGVVGNNQELNREHRGNLSALIDNNPDSWFEYERVISTISNSKEPLVLDLTINLGDPKIINRIRINPNNFGTKTVINVDEIETSLDGNAYTSIKDDIPIAGFVTQDEENVFQLAPSTSKFAGQGVYSFTPRKVKYVHFVLRQSEPYLISTSTGDKLRYAIGLRDIDLRALTYKGAGEILSVPFESQNEIRKVLLSTNQNPSQASELASIQYLISPDDGATWHEIQPKEFQGPSGLVGTQEILDFNGPATNSILTPAPVKSLRLKSVLKRIDSSFATGSSSLYKNILTKSELHQVPETPPFLLHLNHPPVDGTVMVVDPLFGSRGIPESPYILGHVADRLNLRKYRLPFKNFPRPVKKTLEVDLGRYFVESLPASEWMHLEVGGEEWTHAVSGLTTYGVNDKVFVFDINEGVIYFGDGTCGKVPEENEPLALYFDAEQLFPSEVEDDHVAKLDYPTSANKDDMTIKRYDKVEEATQIISKRATVIRLGHENITDLGNIATVMTGSQVDYLNGRDELTVSGEWSINTDNGVIFRFTPTSDSEELSIQYSHQPIYTLSKDEWDWTDTELLRGAVSIKEDIWKTISVEDEENIFASGGRVLDLEHLSVQKDTLTFNLVSGTDVVPGTENPFQKEVEYQDGLVELGGSVVKAVERIPTHSGGGVNTFSFTETVSPDSSFSILFTSSYGFLRERTWDDCIKDGDYSYNRSLNQYQVYWETTFISQVSLGEVIYYYDNHNYSSNGLYSVDYKLGRIFTQVVMSSAWSLETSYDYTDFKAEYRIARLLDPNSYVVNITDQTIAIKDNEILKHLLIPHGRMDGRLPYYLVNYSYVSQTREEIEELKDYFSPVIKDYVLKILTKGKIY